MLIVIDVPLSLLLLLDYHESTATKWRLETGTYNENLIL